LARFSSSGSGGTSADTQGVRDEEHDRATNCGDPEEEHI
jgi:hypothetical protein